MKKQTLSILRKLNTPAKIQDYLNSLPYNPSDEVSSVEVAVERGTAHCLEGALIGAAALALASAKKNQRPLLLDLRTKKYDDDHVVALYKKDGFWGAVSKTSHPVLRFRDPVYKSVRELAMSYFHEYFLDSGEKTLLAYSRPFSLTRYKNTWLDSTEDLYMIGADLDDAKHEEVAPKNILKNLRLADPIERASSKMTSEKS